MEQKPIIEICVESVESVIAAEQGKADRVELCSDLFEGGLTPTLGTLRIAKKVSSIPLYVMIRPRGGDFCYSKIEFDVMKENARIFKEEGADALVVGILSEDGTIDKERMEEFINIARPLPVTFHRAFDMTKDPYESLETLITLGVDRVLSSGFEATAMDGFRLLKELVKIAGERIIIMPGGRISERSFDFLREQIQAKEYHMPLPSLVPSRMQWRPNHIYMGGALRKNEYHIEQTDPERVLAITQILT
ncbi:MAG: copper homeostasis protein CutC [Sphaerochaetaceae bacterium]|nr:copper homeostasis protein CutC [Sphaerochaetaceae bacterium]MDD3366359.1 copper homeostasis protein CutC [Sphaerochaetaceae bacterium]MDD4219047.1 copper homeostasis protein CutC [Sphaerochaetaceae bacterium]MDY0371333.1 copper homeostasis protein CutC [Sphaerochaetaceae bacterium]